MKLSQDVTFLRKDRCCVTHDIFEDDYFIGIPLPQCEQFLALYRRLIKRVNLRGQLSQKSVGKLYIKNQQKTSIKTVLFT